MIYSRAGEAEAERFNDEEFLGEVKEGYLKDTLFQLIQIQPKDYREFSIIEGLVWRKNIKGDKVLCLPRNHDLLTRILSQAHETMEHYGQHRTEEYLRRWYWWPRMGKEIRKFCESCPNCQRAKGENQVPRGKLHPLPIPTKPWDSIGMDFIGPFPEVKGFNYL